MGGLVLHQQLYISRDTPIRINFGTVYLQAFRRLLNNLVTLYKSSIPMETNRHDINQLRLIYIKVQLNELRANIDAYKENTKTMMSFIEAFNKKHRRETNVLISWSQIL
jgi:hypothetical protein